MSSQLGVALPEPVPDADLDWDPDDARPEGFLDTAGAMITLSWRSLAKVRHAFAHYLPEIIRQAGILVVGSTGIIMLICFFAGGTCGLEIGIIGRQFGAPTLVPGAEVLCAVREIPPFVFGYILAAKVGCGIVAELGAMQVREEVDAIEAIGVRSIAYLTSTRLIAAAAVLPFAFILSQAAAAFASFLVAGVRFGDVSSGTWLYMFFSFLGTSDVLRVFIKGMTMAAFVVFVSLYFGYNVRGGPVEVGVATARSMAVNIVGVTIINVCLSTAFWGAGVPFPIA